MSLLVWVVCLFVCLFVFVCILIASNLLPFPCVCYVEIAVCSFVVCPIFFSATKFKNCFRGRHPFSDATIELEKCGSLSSWRHIVDSVHDQLCVTPLSSEHYLKVGEPIC